MKLIPLISPNPMKVNLNYVLKDYQGEVLTDHKDEPAILKAILLDGLNSFDKSENPTPQDKLQMYVLSNKIALSDEVELSFEDMTLLKKRAGLAFKPIVYGQINDILDGKIDTCKEQSDLLP